MYLLKQWPLKSSTPPCLSSSPQLLCSRLPNPLLVSPPLPIRPTLAQAVESPIYRRGLKGGGFGVASLQQCRLYERSQYSEESVVWAPQSTQSATGDLCTIMSSPFVASTLPSSFFLIHSSPSIPLLSFSVPPLAKTLSSVCDPSVAPPCLAACGSGAGAVHGQAPSTRCLPPLSCLAMDEKRRQICLWFKVHPGNYSD